MQLIFLGCSDEHGVPRVGCECDVCRSAASPGSRNTRTGPSLAVRYGPTYAERLLLVDAAPEFRLQATRLGLSRFDALLLTHIHDTHILGLGPLLMAQREAGMPLAVCAPEQVLDDAAERFAYLWNDKAYRRILQPRPADGPLDLWSLEVSPLRVDHGLGGTAYGYLFSLGSRRLAYVSEIETWKRSVMDIIAAQELIREAAPAQAILTHLSHSVDYEEVTSRLSPPATLAYDGLVVEVQE